jgi:hypothetical protein
LNAHPARSIIDDDAVRARSEDRVRQGARGTGIFDADEMPGAESACVPGCIVA